MNVRVWTIVALIALTSLTSAEGSSTASSSEPPKSFVDLTYPAEALAARVTGAVVVRVKTDASGQVIDAQPLSGPAVLRPGVVANVKRWTLAPGARTDTLVYRFEIDDGVCNEDRHGLFRLVQPNLAVITACTAPRRAAVPVPTDEVPFRSLGSAPSYPDLARSARITGVVVLELTIDTSGAVAASRALNDLPMLSQAAVTHSKTWRVRTSATRKPGQGIVVYEFAFDNRDCTTDTRVVLWRVTADYLRLSACGPLVTRSRDLARLPPEPRFMLK